MAAHAFESSGVLACAVVSPADDELCCVVFPPAVDGRTDAHACGLSGVSVEAGAMDAGGPVGKGCGGVGCLYRTSMRNCLKL